MLNIFTTILDKLYSLLGIKQKVDVDVPISGEATGPPEVEEPTDSVLKRDL